MCTAHPPPPTHTHTSQPTNQGTHPRQTKDDRQLTLRHAEGLHETGQQILSLLHLDLVDLLQQLLLLAGQLMELLLHGFGALGLVSAARAARLQQLRLLQHVHLQLLIQLVKSLLVKLLLRTDKTRNAGSRPKVVKLPLCVCVWGGGGGPDWVGSNHVWSQWIFIYGQRTGLGQIWS